MIHAEKANFPVSRMGELLEVSRSGYYAWVERQHAEPGPRAARRAELAVQIAGFHEASDGVNGAPRILADLREAGEVVSRKTVAKIMAAGGDTWDQPAAVDPGHHDRRRQPALDPGPGAAPVRHRDSSTACGPPTSPTWAPGKAGCTCVRCVTAAPGG